MKGIRAKCPYPAQLRINLEMGEKTFSALMDSAPTLKELGIEVYIEKRTGWRENAGMTGGARKGEDEGKMLHSQPQTSKHSPKKERQIWSVTHAS
ncbi:hypothetical protein LDENG_00047880 [Lucifuga dentata]|nr:hypothetical protein LDENG_00047880 [Lucifuga dentata]